jgi:hypothetical protein
MKYSVEVGSGAMIYISRFIKKCSAVQNLIGDGIRLLLFFQNLESRQDVGFELWPGYQLFSLHPPFRLGYGY